MATDADVAAARQGDPQALERLAQEIWPLAYRVALAVLADRDAAQDAAQDAVVSSLRALPGLRSAAALPAYARRTAARLAHGEVQRAQRERPTDQLLAAPSFIGEDLLELRRAIAAMAAEDRIPLLLYYGAGLTSFEIGEALGIAATAVRFRLMRAKDRLRRELSNAAEGDVRNAAR